MKRLPDLVKLQSTLNQIGREALKSQYFGFIQGHEHLSESELSQLEINAIFLSCVRPERISLPIIKIAAFTFFIFFFIEDISIYEL